MNFTKSSNNFSSHSTFGSKSFAFNLQSMCLWFSTMSFLLKQHYCNRSTSLNFCPTTTPLHHASSHTKFHGFLLQSLADLTILERTSRKNNLNNILYQKNQPSCLKVLPCSNAYSSNISIPINSNGICFPFFFWSHTPRSL